MILTNRRKKPSTFDFFLILTFTGSVFQEAGPVTFDRFPMVRSINFGQLLTADAFRRSKVARVLH